MRCARVGRWSGAYLPPRNPRTANGLLRSSIPEQSTRQSVLVTRREVPCSRRCLSNTARRTRATVADLDISPQDNGSTGRTRRSKKITNSAKLAALHARLSLPTRFSLNTLSKCLIHPSANSDPELNNASLAILGRELLAYYSAEWLITRYPRLPMSVLFAAQYAYSGDKTLSHMTREWGVEAADAPGEEVDPGYLQFERVTAGNSMAEDMMHLLKDTKDGEKPTGTGRPREEFHHRRGVSSRIVYDDEFGDLRSGVTANTETLPLDARGNADIAAAALKEETKRNKGPEGVTLQEASASFIRAVFGALYLYAGAQSMQSFHRAHILSRHLPIHTLFNFRKPTIDLARLCDREGFEPPVARLIAETGRKSRSPVFVVGVFSGNDKLGEDAGASLEEGRVRASAQALRSWYLYSPPEDDIKLPSQQADLDKKGQRWKAQHIDKGEVVT